LKKVLIVTYYFPPRPAVGSLRPAGLAKYLPEFGWEVVVLTAKLPDKPAPEFKVIETRYDDTFGFAKRYLGLDSEQNLMTQIAQLKKKLHIKSEKSILDLLLAPWGEITAYPDPQKGWRRYAVEAGNDLLQREPMDAMISTSSPATSHIVAKELKEEFGIPWIADFRDLWTQNYYYPYSPMRRVIEKRLELKTMHKADALVTVSEPTVQKLGALHKGKPIYMIPNGFDPEEASSPNVDLTNEFTITYTGNLYPGKQSPEPLFIALGDLLSQRIMDAKDVLVQFYGAEAGWIDKQAERHGLKDIVKQFGIVPRRFALDKQRESQVLLLLKWNDPRERGYYSAKIFEYLAAKRPIFAIGGFDDVISDLLEKTGAGTWCSTAEEAKGILKELYDEYKTAGRVTYKGDEIKINKYSQREMARRFTEVLNRIV
jgi:hypothetical protein